MCVCVCVCVAVAYFGGGAQGARAPPSVSRMNTIKELIQLKTTIKFIRARV